MGWGLSKKDESKPGLYNSLVHKIIVGLQLQSNSNLRSFWGLAVIRDYPEDGSIFVKKYHTWQDGCYS